jgi:protein SCO1
MAETKSPKTPQRTQRPWLIMGFGLALAAGIALQLFQPSPTPSTSTSGEAQIGGAFELTDQNGQPRTAASFLGEYMLVYFGYSFCPDVCPTDLAAMSAAMARLSATNANKLQPIFITIDPQRDTVAALKQFAANFHPRLVALTGSEAQIEVAKKAYFVFAKKNIDAADPKNYLVDHTALLYLIGPDGKYVAHLAGGSTPEAITAWLQQKIS